MALFVFDLDGTLRDDRGVPMALSSAIADLQERGHSCTIATSRRWPWVTPERLGFVPNAPTVTENGGRVGERYFGMSYPEVSNLVISIHQLIKEGRLASLSFTIGSSPWYIFWSQDQKVPWEYVRLCPESLALKEGEVVLALFQALPSQVTLNGDLCQEDFPGNNATIKKGKQNGCVTVDVNASGVNKGSGLNELLLLCPSEKVFVAGNGIADVPLFAEARKVGGHCVAVGLDIPRELAIIADQRTWFSLGLARVLRKKYL